MRKRIDALARRGSAPPTTGERQQVTGPPRENSLEPSTSVGDGRKRAWRGVLRHRRNRRVILDVRFAVLAAGEHDAGDRQARAPDAVEVGANRRSVRLEGAAAEKTGNIISQIIGTLVVQAGRVSITIRRSWSTDGPCGSTWNAFIATGGRSWDLWKGVARTGAHSARFESLAEVWAH